MVALGLVIPWVLSGMAFSDAFPSRSPVAVSVRGIVVPGRMVDVRSNLSGRILAVRVKPGDKVEPGELLFELDARELEFDLAMAEATMVEHEWALNLAQNSLEGAGLRVKLAEKELELAESYRDIKSYQLQAARDELARLSQIDAEGSGVVPFVTKVEVASNELARATLDVEKEVEELALAHNGRKDAQARLRVEEARFQAAKIHRDRCQFRLKESQVLAPFSGIVSKIDRQAGDTIMGMRDSVLRLVSVDDPRVELRVPVQLMGQLTVGMDVKIKFASLGDEPLMGRVASVAPVVDPKTETFPVSVNFRVPEGLPIPPGTRAEVLFE